MSNTMPLTAKEKNDLLIRNNVAFRPESDVFDIENELRMTYSSAFIFKPTVPPGEYRCYYTYFNEEGSLYTASFLIRPTYKGYTAVNRDGKTFEYKSLKELITTFLGYSGYQQKDFYNNQIILHPKYKKSSDIASELEEEPEGSWAIGKSTSNVIGNLILRVSDYSVFSKDKETGEVHEIPIAVSGNGFAAEIEGARFEASSIDQLLEKLEVLSKEEREEALAKIAIEKAPTREELKVQAKWSDEIEKSEMFKDISKLDAEAFLEKQAKSKPKFIIRPGSVENQYFCSIFVPPIVVHHSFSAMPLETLKDTIAAWTKADRESVKKRIEMAAEEARLSELTSISRAHESSMRQATAPQMGMMQAVKIQYADKMQKMGGREAVLMNFQKYLAAEYEKNAPKYKGKPLPLNYDREYDTQDANELYFLNPFHTAWRYFQTPNPWIDRNAEFAAHDASETATHAALSEEMKTNLAYLWLAASDESITPIMKGMTVEDMKRQFAEEISHLDRAHNWDEWDNKLSDEEKAKRKPEMLAKYGKIVDDMGLDNPTCPPGVTQPLMQSIFGHPLSLIGELNPLNVKNQFGELVTLRFNEYLSGKTQDEIRAFLNAISKKYVTYDATDADEKLLKEFKLSKQDITEILETMTKQYGDRFLFGEMRTSIEHYPSYYAYIRNLANQDVLEAFFEKLQDIAKRSLTTAPVERRLPQSLAEHKVARERTDLERREERKKQREMKFKLEKRPRVAASEVPLAIRGLASARIQELEEEARKVRGTKVSEASEVSEPKREEQKQALDAKPQDAKSQKAPEARREEPAVKATGAKKAAVGHRDEREVKAAAAKEAAPVLKGFVRDRIKRMQEQENPQNPKKPEKPGKGKPERPG